MKAILKYHRGNITQALEDLFPDAPFDTNSLSHLPLPGITPFLTLSSPLSFSPVLLALSHCFPSELLQKPRKQEKNIFEICERKRIRSAGARELV